jgi:hypothetical protein
MSRPSESNPNRLFALFCNSAGFFLLEGMTDKDTDPSAAGRRQKTETHTDKTMKILHSIIADLRPANSTLARRITFPLLLLGAGLLLVRPCAGQSGTWTATSNLLTGRTSHTATLLPNGKVLVAGGFGYANATITFHFNSSPAACPYLSSRARAVTP